MIVSLNIPDGSASQLVDGVCTATGWTVGSGKTKAEWAKASLVSWMKETAKRGLLMEQRTSITGAIDPVDVT
jgi:hypothetical protein